MVIYVNLFKLNFQTCSATDFISFWNGRYNEGKYSDEDYEKNLNRRGFLTPKNVQYLLEWKNAKPLSKRKQALADRTKRQIAKFNKFRSLHEVSEPDFQGFWSFISTIISYGIVWKVYLLHISRPNDFPIVDQHVLRAWNFLTKRRVEEPEQTLENYRRYRFFFFELTKQSGKDPRIVDRALMAFGQFLKSQFFPMEEMTL